MRIFEAMQTGRVPVILSDDWLPPAFVDWSSCALQVPERDVRLIPSILREHEPDADAMGRRARSAWREFFAPDRHLRTLVLSCLDIVERDGLSVRSRAAIAARALTTRAAASAARARLTSRLRR